MATWSDRPPCTSVSARPSDHRRAPRRVGRLRWLIIAALSLAVVAPTGAAQLTVTLDRILAIVDGQIIMHSDVRAFIDLRLVDLPAGPSQEVDVLTFLIERRVLIDQVDRFVVAEPAPDLVDRRIDLIRSRLPGGVAELDVILDRVGFASDDLRQLVADDIRRDAYLADRFDVVAVGLRETAVTDWVGDLVRRAQVRRVPSGASLPGLPESTRP